MNTYQDHIPSHKINLNKFKKLKKKKKKSHNSVSMRPRVTVHRRVCAHTGPLSTSTSTWARAPTPLSCPHHVSEARKARDLLILFLGRGCNQQHGYLRLGRGSSRWAFPGDQGTRSQGPR